MGTKWRGNTGSLSRGYLTLIKSANLDIEQRSAENVSAVISSCLRISMLVRYWHMLVNVGSEGCSLDVPGSTIWHQFSVQQRDVLSPFSWAKSESVSAMDVKLNFLFI